jgi:hypothetical protein
VLFDDTVYWLPGGVTVLNPPVPPPGAYVSIREVVYDDAEGRLLLAAQLGGGLTHGNGNVIPAFPLELYTYTITNITYGNGPFTGTGMGVSGFTIPNVGNVPHVMYGPNAANDNWNEHPLDPNFNWQIDANGDQVDGDGTGILQTQSRNSFHIVVPAGTEHGFINNSSVNTWNPLGITDALAPTDFVFGFVSAPVPEPTGAALVVAALVASRTARTARRASRPGR